MVAAVQQHVAGRFVEQDEVLIVEALHRMRRADDIGFVIVVQPLEARVDELVLAGGRGRGRNMPFRRHRRLKAGPGHDRGDQQRRDQRQAEL